MNTDELQSYHAQQIKEYRNESMNQLKYITPQFYHQWLEDCPIKWERIGDDITTQTIKFYLPLEGESNNNKEAN